MFGSFAGRGKLEGKRLYPKRVAQRAVAMFSVLNECLIDKVFVDKSATALPYDRSRCLVNHLHLFFIHPATVHLDFRDSRVDLTKIRRRELNIDGS